MSTISWHETIPSITSTVGSFPRYAQSVWTSISGGLGTSLNWPGFGGGSDNSGGDILPGASRAFLDVKSKSSTPNSQATARLFLASDTSDLFVYDSAATYWIGNPATEIWGVSASSTTGAWMIQNGSASTAATQPAISTVTFATPYAATPSIQLTSGVTNYTFALQASSQASFSVIAHQVLAGTSTFSYYWWAVGPSGKSY